MYRRTQAESPARAEELHHAQQEGIEFHWLTAPVEILGDANGDVRAMRCDPVATAVNDQKQDRQSGRDDERLATFNGHGVQQKR